jgi:hypothetical protein
MEILSDIVVAGLWVCPVEISIDKVKGTCYLGYALLYTQHLLSC